MSAGEVKLFVAVPVYGNLDPFFTASLLKLVADPPVEMKLRPVVGDSLVSRARNTLTADFLESDCTHMLFIDSDLIFGGDQVRRIAEHQEEVVGGLYPKKQEGDVAWVLNGCDQDAAVRPDGLQEVKYVGTGFMRIARCVFEAMIDQWGEQLRYVPDHRKDRCEYDFWSVGTYQYPNGSRRYLSEDWFFCQRWLDLGGQVWADTRIILKHVGPAIYPLQSQAQSIFSQPAVSPAAADPGAGGGIAPVSSATFLEKAKG